MPEFRPEPARAARIAIVVSRFNEPFTRQLLDGALARLRKLCGADADADVFWVPGAFELAQVAAWFVGGVGEKVAQPSVAVQDGQPLTNASAPATQPAQPGTAVPPSRRYDGILALGCLIKGETDHYAVLAAEAARRLGEVALARGVPLCFGVLTCQTVEQAAARADPSREDKGGEVLQALLELIALRKTL